MNDAFELATSERHSALWTRLLGHFEDKLRIARGKNDGDLSDIATAHMRGQIAVYKSLIALDQGMPIVE